MVPGGRPGPSGDRFYSVVYLQKRRSDPTGLKGEQDEPRPGHRLRFCV
jgi:hypothetical protein